MNVINKLLIAKWESIKQYIVNWDVAGTAHKFFFQMPLYEEISFSL